MEEQPPYPIFEQFYYVMKKYLITLFILASCNTNNEKWLNYYASISCEKKRLEDKRKNQILDFNKELLKQKENLEKELSEEKQKYLLDIQINKDSIAALGRNYIKELKEVKADHFFKYGHRTEHAASLDKAIDQLKNEKEIKQNLLMEKINHLQNKLENNPVIIYKTKELLTIRKKIENFETKINDQYKYKMDSYLEDLRR